MAGRKPDKITSPGNPMVKYARKLHRRRVREAEGRCFLEGVRLVADALQSRVPAVMGFWEVSLLGQPGGEALLRRLQEAPPTGGLFEVSAPVMAEVADTEAPQGIVVVVDRPSPDPPALLEPGPEEGPARTLVVLDNIRDPGNVGTVIRSADAAGARGVVFLPGTADPYGPKALRAAMGSTFHLPVVAGEHLAGARGQGPGDRPGEERRGRTGLATLFPEVLREHGYRVFVADAAGRLPHWKTDFTGRVALVLGGEAGGADPVLWSGAERVAVPLLGRAESLNVGMAASVLLYEIARCREGWKRESTRKDST